MRSVNIGLIISHVTSSIVLLFREIRETTLGTLGQSMKLLEVVGLGFFVVQIVKCLQIMSYFQYYEYMYFKFTEHQHCFRPGLVNKEFISQWAGTTLEILQIELLLFFAFAITGIILLVRSRCQPIGADNTQ